MDISSLSGIIIETRFVTVPLQSVWNDHSCTKGNDDVLTEMLVKLALMTIVNKAGSPNNGAD